MPCDKLAVQTATIAENVASVLMDPTAVQMLAQAFGQITGDAEVRVTSNLGGHVYRPQRPLAEIITPETRSVFFYARNIGIAINSSGRLTSLDGYYADYDNANPTRARSILDQFVEMVKAAAPPSPPRTSWSGCWPRRPGSPSPATPTPPPARGSCHSHCNYRRPR